MSKKISRSIIETFYRIKEKILLIEIIMKKIAKLVYKLPSLLTLKNLRIIIKYTWQFGPTATYHEVFKRFWWLDSVFVTKANNATPVINNDIGIIKERVVPEEDAVVSVVIPTKNAGDKFRHLLSQMKNQKGFKNVEIIIVDSGSTDKSIEIADEFEAKIIKILPEEFSHSCSRNLGVEHASGDYVLFTVQDALPPSEYWLCELFKVIKDNGLVAASCAEFPREHSDLFYRAVSWNHYRFLEIDRQDRIMRMPDEENHLTLRKNANLSNIACLIMRDVFTKYKFRGNYGEDLDLGIRLIRDGHKLALLSSTRIIHSHDRPAYYYLKRGYVDTLFAERILQKQLPAIVEMEPLLNDMVFSYEILKSLVNEDIQRSSLPCTIKDLSIIVMEKFHTATKNNYPTAIDMTINDYIDINFRSFLENAYSRYKFNKENKLQYDGNLLYAMKSFTRMIFEYMDITYEQIDDHVLEDFKRCLVKAYAFQCGVYLAFCFLLCFENTDEKMREINEELIKGI